MHLLPSYTFSSLREIRYLDSNLQIFQSKEEKLQFNRSKVYFSSFWNLFCRTDTVSQFLLCSKILSFAKNPDFCTNFFSVEFIVIFEVFLVLFVY